MKDIKAEIRLSTKDVREDIAFFTKILGMRMDMIFPADNPQTAIFSGYGLRLRVEKGAKEAPATLRILCDDPDGFAKEKTEGARNLTAPNGTKIEIVAANPAMIQPATNHSFVVRRLADQAPWIIGRAGMHYRDLIPDRLGGSIIASHIRIPDGGPVPDMVHFHKVGFQLIFCVKGWVDVVYEDQGPQIRLMAGDCFIQPPEIRHRVLYASPDIEVLEIGVPAEHITEIDHEMTLPNPQRNPTREWNGQRFVHHKAQTATWTDFRLNGMTCRDTTIAENTRNVAGVQVVKPNDPLVKADWTSHDCDIHFSFLMSGQMTLEGEGRDPVELTAGDAFVIPPHMKTRYSELSDDFELIEVSLPGVFETIVEG